jgi:hypothetical protein
VLKILYHHLTLLVPEQASPYARWLREWISDVQIFSVTRKLLMHVVETTCPCQLHCSQEAGEAGANYRGAMVWKGARSTSRYHVFVFLDSIIICRLYKLAISYQAQITVAESQSFPFSVKIFSGPTLAAGPKKFSTLLSAALANYFLTQNVTMWLGQHHDWCETKAKTSHV